MRPMLFPLSVVAAGVLSACAQVPPNPAPKGTPDPVILKSCGADQFQDLVGQSYALSNMTQLPGLVRIIPWGSAVTMDYNAERTNVALDRNDVILRVFCG